MDVETLEPLSTEPTHAHRVPAGDMLTASNGKFSVRWASCELDVREVQRLRYLVFAEELGAHLVPPEGIYPGLDADGFDPFCDHLMVSSVIENCIGAGKLIGTYRVLPPQAARRAGGLYIDTEFDLVRLSGLRGHAVELGRSCVHPDWRSGAVIMALWTALLQYMLKRELDTMIGCASVSLEDGGQAAAGLWNRLQHTHLVAPDYRVQPRVAWKPLIEAGFDAWQHSCHPASAPPLIKGYLRCGALLLGPPALDTAFNTADLPMMLQLGNMAPRYQRHFLRQ